MVSYDTIDRNDVIQWWKKSDAAGSSRNRSSAGERGQVFLFGHHSDNTSGRIDNGVAQIQSSNTRVIFPIINSRTETEERAKDDIDKANRKEARLNRDDILSNARRQELFKDDQWSYDGLWISMKGLSDGDIIEFGGNGPRRFETDAKWTIRIS